MAETMGVFTWMRKTEEERKQAAELAAEYARGYMAGWKECFDECLRAVKEESVEKEVIQ